MKTSMLLVAASLIVAGCSSTSSDKAMKGPAPGEAKSSQFWWPEALNLQPLRQHSAESSPLGEKFDYAKEFKKLNLAAVKQDIKKVLTFRQNQNLQEQYPNLLAQHLFRLK